ncbi:DNA alkylation repair protein [Thiomicrorhabdus xiamenensis]|uniref:DNA alkylation repair protein n=1 Tax=Thiomicrorhabdus xiamenensis TaxID=2739063 RepID=A0A7D4P6F9_9GAMM|nr:DNA alkylation repair protein [Thiomicrorhabdus xiamenensis]QKI90316.1 DNA alkylation repair protein [Thiomicrorhabdus xiamenensis]
MDHQRIIETLKALGDPEIAARTQSFFKTGHGDYGYGDRFLGIRVPVLRKRLPDYRTLALQDAEKLLSSHWHEVRLFALLLLVDRFQRGDEKIQEQVFRIYLSHTSSINSWDLVDSSAPQIVGAYLYHRHSAIDVLNRLAQSESLWERRIAIVACFYFIRQGTFDEALALSEQLLDDAHDLIHKAVGWMLREIGKRDLAVEQAFLARHYRKMPRTMLRYAIEKFPEETRLAYLKGKIGNRDSIRESTVP